MNARRLATEAVIVIATTLWVYAGVAVIVAQLGEGRSLSFATVLAIVLLSHVVGRALPRLDMGDGALRLLGAVLSLALIYLVLRIEIDGNAYLWDLAWLGGLLSATGDTLEGRSGDVAAVVLLSLAWFWGVARGSATLTFEGFAAEATAGLVVVLIAALFVGAADAPGAVAWLPVPYLAAVLVALALIYYGVVVRERSRPFAGVWALWVCGSLLVIGAVSLPAALIDLEVLSFIGAGIRLALQGIGLALVWTLMPPLVGLVWVFEHMTGFVFNAEPFTPEMPTTDELTQELLDEDSEAMPWTAVMNWIFRIGVVSIAVALALMLLWFAFRRDTKREEDEVDLREQVLTSAGGGFGSILSGALDRLRDRFAGGLRGRDAIGRLYLGMLDRAAAEGLPRPPAATPIEFAPRLDAHYESPLPSDISATYASARYGGKPVPKDDVERLSAQWREMQRRDD